ncbi:antibiotic biosynthesis monooxygenase family protein [Brevibacillus choshinensis]|uniref:Antibiotic biosynthesis monooxygenase n=1 Tax=Brevibacillus choshinensis TaxID=54911 RepID=A0ABX7FQD7_BRECH|nr:antibiotic biosynthesis monooxygenase [Brevibacillus choshinensis]QRG68463.1 antibiotic biosynthesis monooxygenase [Brevibacillus choshinensis]
MFARMVFFKLEPGSRRLAEKVVQELNLLARKQKGFRGNSYFFEDHKGEYAALNYWESKKDAESANAIMFPHFREAVKDAMKEEPDLRIFEVYDPMEKVPLDTSVSLYDY